MWNIQRAKNGWIVWDAIQGPGIQGEAHVAANCSELGDLVRDMAVNYERNEADANAKPAKPKSGGR